MPGYFNAENLKTLADIIEELPTIAYGEVPEGCGAFSMSYIRHACQTPACIMGWASATFENGVSDLGIPDDLEDMLFTPMGPYADYLAQPWEPGHITAKRAAAVLRHAADFGIIDWRIDESGNRPAPMGRVIGSGNNPDGRVMPPRI